MLEAIDAGDDLQQWEVDLPPKVIEAAAVPIQRMMELSAAS
jgi:quinolinate synthase